MKIRRPFLMIAVSLLAVLLGSGGIVTGQPVHAQTASVGIQNYMFTPSTLTVPVGATVTWVNHDGVAHTTTSDSGVWDSGAIAPGASYSHTFSQAGTFPYHCNIHPNMHGVIVVGSAPQPGMLAVSVIPSVVAAGSTAMVHGTGFTPQNQAFVFWQRPDGTTRGIWVFTDPMGMFTLTLGFNPRHGTGTEFVTAFDFATGRWAPYAQVSVVAGPVPAPSQLSATINPVVNGGTTAIVGQGFTPGGLVFVQWMRPDGTMTGVWVRAGGGGSFAFGFLADPRHGCGPRIFVAFDATRGMWSSPFVLGVRC